MCRRIREYEDLVGIDSPYITRVAEDDSGGEEALQAVVERIQNEHDTLTDTRPVTEDDQQNVFVYPDLKALSTCRLVTSVR